MLQFRVNREKTVGALLHLIGEANARGSKPSQYDLVKSLFLADRAHLNKFGRPITFDKYVAMAHGPVPSYAYDLLKTAFNWDSVGRDSAPWLSEQDGKAHRFSVTERTATEKTLSPTDRACLNDALGTVLSLTFGQIRRLTHEDRAYVSAWRDEEETNAFPMDMTLLLDEVDEETIDELHYLAEMTAA